MSNTDNTTTTASLTADAAELARVALAAATTKAKALGTAHLVKLYGANTDSASIGLATKAAAVMGGAAKPRGGAADRINKVIGLVTANADGANTPESIAKAYTPAVFATAARVVLDKAKADQAAIRKADSDARAAAKAVANDRSAPVASRKLAFEHMAELDGKADRAKADALAERVTRAIESARDAGYQPADILAVMDVVFPGWDAEQHKAA
jgi:hypothetical protein